MAMLAVAVSPISSMRKSDRNALTKWAIEKNKPDDQRNPSLAMTRTANQALAVEIHRCMKHGEWRTSKVIASELKKPLSSVRLTMNVISKLWGYEVSKCNGYRRIL